MTLDIVNNHVILSNHVSINHVLKAKDVEELIETLEKEVSNLPLEKDPYEEKLKVYEKLLHPNHHIMIDLKFTLVQVRKL